MEKGRETKRVGGERNREERKREAREKQKERFSYTTSLCYDFLFHSHSIFWVQCVRSQVIVHQSSLLTDSPQLWMQMKSWCSPMAALLRGVPTLSSFLTHTHSMLNCGQTSIGLLESNHILKSSSSHCR